MSPTRLSLAPVNAPLRWPKNSDSNSASGIAVQFTATKGCDARRLARCTARASSSLPVPLSPWMRMLESVCATLRAEASNDSISGLRVTISARHALSSRVSLTGLPEARNALPIVAVSCSLSKGFVR